MIARKKIPIGQVVASVGGESFSPIAENQYGIHPAFNNQTELTKYILENLSSGQPTDPFYLEDPTILMDNTILT